MQHSIPMLKSKSCSNTTLVPFYGEKKKRERERENYNFVLIASHFISSEGWCDYSEARSSSWLTSLLSPTAASPKLLVLRCFPSGKAPNTLTVIFKVHNMNWNNTQCGFFLAYMLIPTFGIVLYQSRKRLDSTPWFSRLKLMKNKASVWITFRCF